MNEKEIDYNLLEVEKGNKRSGIYLKNHIQDQYKEIVRLIARIDKAIEYIQKIIISGKSEHSFNEFAVDFQQTKEGKILLDILKGE